MDILLSFYDLKLLMEFNHIHHKDNINFLRYNNHF